jgi:hypothetical protein
MVVRRAAPSSLRMIIHSIVEAARSLDNVLLRVARLFARPLQQQGWAIL